MIMADARLKWDRLHLQTAQPQPQNAPNPVASTSQSLQRHIVTEKTASRLPTRGPFPAAVWPVRRPDRLASISRTQSRGHVDTWHKLLYTSAYRYVSVYLYMYIHLPIILRPPTKVLRQTLVLWVYQKCGQQLMSTFLLGEEPL